MSDTDQRKVDKRRLRSDSAKQDQHSHPSPNTSKSGIKPSKGLTGKQKRSGTKQGKNKEMSENRNMADIEHLKNFE